MGRTTRVRSYGLVRDDYPWNIGARPVENGHVADPMHQRAAGAPGQLREELVPGVPVTPGGFDLDELVIGERPVGLAGDRIRQSGRPQPNDRLQLVRETAKMASLALGKGWLCGWRRHWPDST